MAVESVGTAFVRIIARGGKGFERSIRKALADPSVMNQVEKSGEDHASAYSDGFGRQIIKKDPLGTMLERLQRGMGKFDAQGRQIGERLSKNIRLELEKRFGRDVGFRIFKGLEDDLRDGRIQIENLGDEFDNLRLRVARANREIDDGVKRARYNFGRFSSAVEDASLVSTRFGNKIGRIFGKGARNDFINIVGILIGRLAQAGSFLGEFAGEALGGSSKFAKLSSTLLATSFAAGAVLLAFGLLASLISGLSAAVVSLAGSITFALLGSLGALAGLLTVVAADVGIMIAAFQSLDGQLKRSLLDALDPFKEGLKEMGDLAAENIFTGLAQELPRLRENFALLTPLVDKTSQALHQVLLDFIALGESPAVAAFLVAMTRFLPDATEQLGRILTQTIAGFLGLFRSMLPLTRRFLGWLEEITANFAEFTNSVEGQNSLKEFWDSAGDAAAAFGGLIVDLTQLLFDMFKGAEGGAAEGNRIFDSLAANIEELRDFLATPQGSAAFEEWLDDGTELIRTLGDLVVGIGKFIGAIDTEASQIALRKLIDGFTTLLNFVAENEKLIVGLTIALGVMGAGLLAVNFTVGVLVPAFGLLGRAVSAVTGFMFSAEAQSRKTQAGFTSMSSAARIAGGLAGVAGLALSMKDAADNGIGFSNVLTGTLSGAMTGLAVGGPIGALIGGVAGGGLTALAGAFKNSGDEAATQAAALVEAGEVAAQYGDIVRNLKDSIDDTTGSFTEMSRKIALSTVRDEDNNVREWAQHLLDADVSLRTVTNAILGQRAATESVNAVLNRNAQEVSTLETANSRLNATLEEARRRNAELGEASSQQLRDRIDGYEEEIAKNQERIDTLNGVNSSIRTELGLGKAAIKQHKEEREAIAPVNELLKITRKRYLDIPTRVRTELRNNVPANLKDMRELAKRLGGLSRETWEILLKARGIDTTEAELDKLVRTGRDKGKKTGEELSANLARQIHVGKTQWVQEVSGGLDNVRTRNANKAEGGGTFLGNRVVNSMAASIRNGTGEVGAAVDALLNNALARVNAARNSFNAASDVSPPPSNSTNRTGSALPDPVSRTVSNSRTANFGGITIITPTEDPVAVATETVNRLAANGYI